MVSSQRFRQPDFQGVDMSEAANNRIQVAVIQAGSRLFDGAACTDRACQLIATAAGQGARLILLPEAFIPGYPRGLDFGVTVGNRSEQGRQLWQRYHDAALVIPGPGLTALSSAARQAGAFVAIGAVERAADKPGTLYCSILYFGPDGTFLGRHRKLKPTAAERVIWGEGDGTTLTVLDTPHGRIGGLICWENYMPLARAALYRQGIALYLAPTADARPAWQSSMVHIACESRAFVLACNQYGDKSMLPADLLELPGIRSLPDVTCRGGSVIVSPLGDVLAGPLWDQEGILYAELDLGDIVRARFDFDASGHYDRPDVFHLDVSGLPAPVVCPVPAAPLS
jgi:nitrilase